MLLKGKLCWTNNCLKNYTKQLLGNLNNKNYTHLLENIWGSDLVEKQLISKFIKGFRFLLCVIDIYSKYVCVVPLKDKKGITITCAFR